MKWNLRMVAAQRDIWRPTELLKAFETVGFTPSLSKVAALWSGTPVTVRLEDLDKICAALDCTVGDLLHAQPLAAGQSGSKEQVHAVGDSGSAPDGPSRPTPRPRRGPRSLPPN